ncbi:B3 domain-containing protein Os05g0481400-like isoform X1 [Papaver somniferum]|uniref:B3 domain-containing protein Os05g0481400-like isoform X1 n=1 Tax=Papaver somniferum TaxID=3469 RepID=UPI000E705A02|nr:B3 domain-containing protein Os05g0481400-like isoform X1 [Papaver somniferum]
MAQGNSYEEARKQRLQDNKRRFQELGVLKIANSLSDVIKDKNNTKRKYQVRSKTAPVNPDLVRRSSRPRSQVTYYGRIKCKTSFIAERSDTLKRAKSFQSGLLSRNPSFVKSMSLSNVSGNFGLNIPAEICKNHLPKEPKVRIMLEDEDGSVYETNYYWVTRYITTGWKTFSMDHKLDFGDALVIELTKPTRFKYIYLKFPTTLVI